MKIKEGDKFQDLKLPNIKGGECDINALRGKKSLITFYRFAQCPFCNLRINEFVKRYDEFDNKLNIIAIFDSPLDHLIKSAERHNAPFDILADENFKYFKKYEIEQSAWKFFLGSVIRGHKMLIAASKGYIPIKFKGSMTTVPVDILIDANGVVEKSYYGKNTTDHLSFDDILQFTKSSV